MAATTKRKNRQRTSPDPRLTPPEKRVSDIVQQWFLTEPLLFGAWSSHQVVASSQIKTIRVGRGRVEFNPEFLRSLDQKTLREVMKFETLRIILKHPYERKKPHLEHALTASNISIGECIGTLLPMPSAESVFLTPEYNNKYFEYYYNLLAGRKNSRSNQSLDGDAGGSEEDSEKGCESEDDRDSALSEPDQNPDSLDSETDPDVDEPSDSTEVDGEADAPDENEEDGCESDECVCGKG